MPQAPLPSRISSCGSRAASALTAAATGGRGRALRMRSSWKPLVANVMERTGRSREQVKARMEKEDDLPALAARIREEKTLDLLKSNASIELT